MKKIILGVIAAAGILSTSVFAQFGEMALYTSLTTAGARYGGLFFDLGYGFGTDVAVSRINENGEAVNGYYADLCWGAWMLAIDGSTSTQPAYKILYCVEGEVSETVTIGISTDLITLQNGTPTQHFSNWDCYVKIPLKL